MQSDNPITSWKTLVRVLWLPATLSVFSWLAAQVNYLLFHSLAESFSIIVAGSALVVASSAMRYTRNHFVVFISVAIGWCAGLDLLHTLAFKGMNVLPTDSANPATQFWIAARFMQAGALVAAPCFLRRPVRLAWLHLVFGSVSALFTLLIFLGYFPDAYVDGQGLTDFKVYGEYAVIGLLALSALLLWRQRARMSRPVLGGMLAAIVAMMLSEFAFTQYVGVYASANLVGHLLKIHAYWFVYLALVRNSVHEPFLQLQDEIRERERLGREREQALHQLGERVKELRCMGAVAALIERPDLQVTQLLQGVAEVLPPGFEHPAAARARIVSEWGEFGAARPGTAPARGLSQPLWLDGRDVGRIVVWYDDALVPADAQFLPEEVDLLHHISRQVCDAIKRLQAEERIQRLRYLYEMLSATTRTVVHSQSRDALLEALVKVLMAHGAFPVVFIAETREDPWPLQLKQHAGIAEDRLPLLRRLLGERGSPLQDVVVHLAGGEVFAEPVPRLPGAAAGDEASDMAQWREYLYGRGITQRAVMPLLCQGRLTGMVALYAGGLSTFDDEQLQLLREIARDMGFALDHLAQRERFEQTSQQARLMELRFQEVFKASPVPMQLMDLYQHRVRALNDAHRQWLGYSDDDLVTDDDWFRLVYPDDQVRSELRAHWEASIAQARLGGPVVSPEITLRRKDGSTRIARGTMTVVGEDAIIAWTDLTELREGERALRESEHRFRSLVEETVTGMYVRREGRYIYVNPRYCEITGWPAEALVGQEVLQFTDPDAQNVDRIRHAWSQVHDGRNEPVSYVVPYRRQDGRRIELGLTAKVITWDDGLPATVVLAEDITERRRTEEQIAAYVKQLEGAMRGTLQAVSNMVELRDPYTAGHERRVGLIASAIAQEMGWPAPRCEALEMLGLVHDVGKIAVPSELLTKPTRLSGPEMDLIRGHAQAGYEILKDVPFPYPVAEIVWQHHERMDGSGYPRGLKGEEILPEARVLAVADVIESMASHRPYRPAVGLEAALAEVAANRGTLYAPEVVDAAIRLVRDKGYVLPT
ncbi:MASE3 domain-containing protein [Ramlibacter sp. MAHUQ-53]|uniref:MASE3 domain-containing protein n=1 Tax=unclassified Ramlibacter TaxID=2617605 RepID=UPI00362DD6E6